MPNKPKGYKRRGPQPSTGERRKNGRRRNAGIRAIQAKFKREGIRSLNREEHEFLKSYLAETLQKKQTRAEKRQENKELRGRRRWLKREASLIVDKFIELREDPFLDNDEREEQFEDLFVDEYGFDLDEWIFVMEEAGYDAHEAYEFWFYP